MKRLILVRHGKSSWEQNLPDEQRPLQKRGKKDGRLVASAFTKFNDRKLVIYSSPATRAHETALIFKEVLNIPDNNFHINSSLYTFSSSDLLQEIKNCSNEIQDLMVFGHNPATTNVVNLLGNRYFENIPTTGLTVIDFETENWSDLKSGKTILNLFPKNLR
ncbi:MAG: histidine phosphatase family protein [Gillisia sp.]